MKRIFTFIVCLLLFAGARAQVTTVQGQPHPSMLFRSTKANVPTAMAADGSFAMDDIKYWVGEGENSAALVIQWNYDDEEHSSVWGYRWSGKATGIDMIMALAQADPRLYVLTEPGTSYGTAVGGFGFDRNGNGLISLTVDGKTVSPYVSGVFTTAGYGYDDYTATDPADYWRSGWYKGYWSYWVKEGAGNFGYSGVGASSRILQNGSWDGWNFAVNMSPTDMKPMAAVPALGPDYTKGTLFLNEDWFGHDNSTINHLDETGEWSYRVYRAANSGKELGVTSQFATVYGDNLYIMSKQASGTGGRFIAADARTLEMKNSFATLPGGGDGRAFVGINPEKAYVGTSAGIVPYSITGGTMGEVIDGTGGGGLYSGQVGLMVSAEKRVFAVKQGTGILVIDALSDKVIRTFGGSYSTLALAADGTVWAAAGTTLTSIKPSTLDTTNVSIPSYARIYDSWGAWNAGSFTADPANNVLYWASGSNGWTPTTVYRYEPGNASSLESPFFSLPGESNVYPQQLYGAGLRYDANSKQLIVTATETGWGNHYENNWVYFVDATTGSLLRTAEPEKYYWFTAMPVVSDKAPVISGLPESLTFELDGKGITSNLEGKVTDSDNIIGGIDKSVSVDNDAPVSATISGNSLVIAPKKGESGEAIVVLKAESGGKTATKKINVTVTRAIESIGFERKNITIKAGSTDTLRVNFSPLNATKQEISYTFGSYSIATQAVGIITARGAGEQDFIATTKDGLHTDTCHVTVVNEPLLSIAMQKPEMSIFVNAIDTLKVDFTPADASQKDLTWTVADPSILSVTSYNKTITGKKAGETTVTATSKDGGYTAECQVRVTFNPATSLSLSQDTLLLNVSASKSLTATFLPKGASNKDLTWSSTNADVATVSQYGSVKAVGAGRAVIKAVSKDDASLSDTCIVISTFTPVESVVLKQHRQTVAIGKTTYLSATVSPSDASQKTLNWSSSNADVASVGTGGGVKGIAIGNAMVYATSADGAKSDTCLITVVDTIHVESIALSEHEIWLKAGKSKQPGRTIVPSNATVTSYAYASLDEAIATVSQYGSIKAVAEGTTKIYVKTTDGAKTDTCTVHVVPEVASIAISIEKADIIVGERVQASCTALPVTAVQGATWSMEGDAATIDSYGTVTALKAGTVALIATSTDNASLADTVVLTISNQPTEEILLTPAKQSIDLNSDNLFLQVQSEVLPENATNKNLRWKTSDYTLATVTSYGLVKAIANGEVTITATAQDGAAQAVCTISITDVPTGIENSHKQQPTLHLFGGELIADNYEGQTIRLFAEDGRTIATFRAESAHACFSVRLVPGIYIIAASDGTSIKTAVK